MLYRTYSTTVVPLPSAADVTTANISNNPIYQSLIQFVFGETIKKAHYIVADFAGYDDHLLYELSMNLVFQLLCQVNRHTNTLSEEKERLHRIGFYG